MAQNLYFATDTGALYADNGAVPLSIPNTFVGNSPDAISKLDTNFTTVAGVVNAGQPLFGLLANRPAAVGTWVLIASANGLAAETLSGLTLSNDSGTPNTVLDIAAGACSSDDAVIANRALMTTAAIVKNMNAAWAVGSTNGGNNAAASLVANTWYHVFLIQRPDTGVVDVLCDTTVTPTLPAGYTKKRRLGSFRTEGSAHIIAFVQDGDLFQWGSAPADFTVTNPGTAAVTRTMLVPTGVNVVWVGMAAVQVPPGLCGAFFSDLATVDQAATAVFDFVIAATGAGGCFLQVRTNTSGQIRSRISSSDGSTVLTLSTIGWIDRRGRG